MSQRQYPPRPNEVSGLSCDAKRRWLALRITGAVVGAVRQMSDGVPAMVHVEDEAGETVWRGEVT